MFIQTDPQSTSQTEGIQDHPNTEALGDALIHSQTQAIAVCHRVRKIWREDEAGSTFDRCSSNEQEVMRAENGQQVFLGKYQYFHRESRGCTLRAGQEKRLNWWGWRLWEECGLAEVSVIFIYLFFFKCPSIFIKPIQKERSWFGERSCALCLVAD